MPYIPSQDRTAIHNDLLVHGLNHVPANAGALNFLVSNLLNNELAAKGLNYARLNRLTGVLVHAQTLVDNGSAPPLFGEDKLKSDGLKAVFAHKDDLLTVIRTLMCNARMAQTIDHFDALGVMTCILFEFQRRVVGPYEDLKIIENGDAYDDAMDLILAARRNLKDRMPTPY